MASPIPSPLGFVVKNGSNMLAATSAGMPGPLSSTVTFASPERCLETRTRMACTRTVQLPHGLEGILHQVQDHLLDLDAIGLDRQGTRRQMDLERDLVL